MAFLDFLGALSPASILFFTRRAGRLVGTDELGNRYYSTPSKRPGHDRPGRGDRRWVLYAEGHEPSTVPAEWFGWLHHQHEAPPAAENPYRRPWQKPTLPNQTGTALAYLPPGHTLADNRRNRGTGDYESWVPPA